MSLSAIGVLAAGGVAGLVNSWALEGTPNQPTISIALRSGVSPTAAVSPSTPAALVTNVAAATSPATEPSITSNSIDVRPAVIDTVADNHDSSGDRSADD